MYSSQMHSTQIEYDFVTPAECGKGPGMKAAM